jgi:predicted nucleic-acid-binding protein
MIGIDTNLLVRLAMQDDPVQCSKVDSFIAGLSGRELGFISLITLIELVWVLDTRYGVPKADVIRFVEELLDAPELKLEREAAVSQALECFKASTADFADCLIERVSHHAGCTHTVTFDRAASKSAGMVLV